MGERVITDTLLLEIIITVLEGKQHEMTPGEINRRAIRRKLLPNGSGFTEHIDEVLRNSYGQ